jgi:hypothetical protein
MEDTMNTILLSGDAAKVLADLLLDNTVEGGEDLAAKLIELSEALDHARNSDDPEDRVVTINIR